MEELAQDGVEETLRRLGFGYRAKYIAKTAKMIQEMDHGEEWLRGLRNLPYEEAHSALLTLQGVGPKVADCIVSLFFLSGFVGFFSKNPLPALVIPLAVF